MTPPTPFPFPTVRQVLAHHAAHARLARAAGPPLPFRGAGPPAPFRRAGPALLAPFPRPGARGRTAGSPDRGTGREAE